MAARGSVPTLIHSDNAAELKLAHKQINWLYAQLNTDIMHKQLALPPYNLTWIHATGKSPAHSGVIERIVGTMKRPLKRVPYNKLFNETEFYTILCDIESGLNMRPLGKNQRRS